MSDKDETVVRKEPKADSDGKVYWTGSEPSVVDKVKSKVGDAASAVYDQAVKSLGEKSALRKQTVKEMKKGGKVAGKLATRGYGKAR